MTDVAPALTSDEIAALAGPSVPRWYMVFDTTSGNTVGTARVNAPGGLTYPLSSLPVDGQDSGWANILPDQTVLIGSTPGGFDRGIYRVRWDNFLNFPDLEIMAIGQNDSGEINLATRNVGISDDDYVTVLDRFDPFGKYPRIIYSGIGLDADIREDWDNGVFTFNRNPPGIANLTIDGQHGNYAAHVFSNTSKTFDITANVILWPTSSSVTWDWVLPAAWTLNSGSLSGSGLTNTINVTAPHSADTYTLQFHVQDDNGINWVAYRKVWIKSFTYPPLDIVRIDSHVDDRTGSKWTITLNKLLGMPPGAMVHLFNAGTWNSVDVPTASKSFTGYVQRRKEATDIGVSNVSLDLVGPSYMLELIGGQSQIMSAVNATPVNWQQLYYLLSYLDFIIWWVLYNRAAGMLQMFNYTPFGLTNTQKRMTDWRIDAGTLLAQVQAQAKRIAGGNFGCDPTGEFMLRVHPSRVPWSDRSSIPVRTQLNAGIYKAAELQYDEHPGVRRLRGECFVSDGLTVDTPYWCDAPIIPGQGVREEKLERLICDSTDEFYEVVGDDFQARNNPYPSGTVQLRNYAVIYPAQMSRVGLDIAPALRYDGVEYDGYVIPTQVSYTHNPDGTVDAALGVEGETVGLPATDVPVPTVDPTTLNSFYQSVPFAPVPSYRSLNPNPAGTKKGASVLPRDGSTHFCGSATHAFVASNFLGTPIYRDVTPSSLGSYRIQHGIIRVGGVKAYLLAYDGTNSAVWSTPNVFALPRPTWTKGANQSGLYTVVRETNVSSGILIYGTSGVTTPIDFTLSDGGFVVDPNQDGVSGHWVAGVGWMDTDWAISGGAGYLRGLSIVKALPSNVITGSSMRYAITKDTSPLSDIQSLAIGSYLPSGQSYLSIPLSGVTDTADNTVFGGPGAFAATQIQYKVFCSQRSTLGALVGQSILKAASYNDGNATVRYSTNDGLTFGSALALGSSPGGVGGFDVQRSGVASFGSAYQEIQKATSLGGSYSSDQSISGASASSIELPWYLRNSLSALNSGGSPQYLFGLPAADGSGHALYWVVGGTPANITPSHSGNPGLSQSANNLTTWKGKYVAGLFSFAGGVRLAASVDGASTWADKGAADGATYIRVRRLAGTPGQIFIAGNGILQYSPDFGTTRINKTMPDSTLVFWEPYG